MRILKKCISFVLATSKQLQIDESHGVMHSLKVLQYAQKIFDSEVERKPYLKNQKNIIDVCCLLHDMCDKKYVDEKSGLQLIDTFLHQECKEFISLNDISVSKNIMMSMSYSTVKKKGYPNLGGFQSAYHIVREADLLHAYDLDRCLVFKMTKDVLDNTSSTIDLVYDEAKLLFNNRILQHLSDNLFVHDWSKTEAERLHKESLDQINTWNRILMLDDE